MGKIEASEELRRSRVPSSSLSGRTWFLKVVLVEGFYQTLWRLLYATTYIDQQEADAQHL